MANRFQQFAAPQAQPAPQPGSNRFARFAAAKAYTANEEGKGDAQVPKPSLAQRNEAAFYGIADTMGLGFADEGAGVIDVVVQKIKGDNRTTGQIYDDFVTKARGDMKKASEAAPADYTVGQVAGILPTLGAGAVKYAAKAPGIIRKTIQGAKAGAGYGAVYGFGSGEGLEDSAIEGAKGAVTGAVVGAALPVAGKVIAAPFKAAKTVVQRKSNYAAQQIAKQTAREGKTVAQVQQELQQLQKTNPDALVVDALGDSGGRLARASLNRGGQGAQELSKKVYNRQAGQNDRITSRISKDLGDPASYQKTLDDAIATLKAKAKPLYQKAYADGQNMNYQKIGRPISLAWSKIPPDVQGAAKKAANDLMLMDGSKAKPIGEVIGRGKDGKITPLPTLEQWDYIKQGIDAVIAPQSTKGAAGEFSKYGARLNAVKNEILAALDSAVPSYKVARQTFGGDLSVKKSLELGRESLNADADILTKTLNGLDQASKDTFRVGYARAMAEVIDRMGPGHDAMARIWQAPGRQKRLKAVFGDLKRFKQFAEFARGEERMRKSYNALSGNSTTARQLNDMTDAGLSGAEPMLQAGSQLVRGDVVGAALTGLRKLVQTASGLTEARADEIARILAMPAIPQGTVNRIGQYQMSSAQRVLLGHILGKAASRGSAVAATGQ